MRSETIFNQIQKLQSDMAALRAEREVLIRRHRALGERDWVEVIAPALATRKGTYERQLRDFDGDNWRAVGAIQGRLSEVSELLDLPNRTMRDAAAVDHKIEVCARAIAEQQKRVSP